MLSLLLTGVVVPNSEKIVLTVPPASQATGFAIRADRRQAVTVDAHGQGLLWSLDGGKPSAFDRFAIEPVYAGANDFGNYQSTAYQVALSPDGNRLVVLHPETFRTRLYTLRPFRLVWDRPGKSPRWSPTWTPKGDAVLMQGLTPDRRGTMGALVSPATGQERPFPVWGPYAFTKDGRRLAGFNAGGAALVEIGTRRVLRRFQERLETLPPIGLSPDEKYLVTGGENPTWTGPGEGPEGLPPTESAYVHDYAIKIWSTATGKRRKLLPGYWQNNAHPLDPTFLPGGKVAFLGLGDTYRLTDGRRVGRFKPLEAYDLSFQSWWQANPQNPLRPTKGQLPNVLAAPAFIKPLPSHRLAMVAFGFFWAFDLTQGRMLAAKDIMPVNGVRQIVPRSDGYVVVSGLNGLHIFSPDLQKSRLVRRPKSPNEDNFPSSEAAIVLPGGYEVLGSEAMGEESRRWSVDTGKVLGTDPRTLLPSESLQFGPNGATYRVRNWPGDASIARLGLANRPMPAGDPQDALSPAAIEQRHGRGAAWYTPRAYIVNGPRFTQDGERLGIVEYASAEKQAFRLLEAETGKELWKTDLGAAGEFALAPDAAWVAVTRTNGVEVIAIPSGQSRLISATMPSQGGLVTLSPTRLILFGDGGPVTVLDVEKGVATAQLVTFQGGDWAAWTPSGAVDGTPGGLAWLRTETRGRLRPVKRNRPDEVWRAIGG
jgi:hypothetical protein